jgi:hypothetical protein
MKLDIPLYYKKDGDYKKSRDKNGEQEYVTLEFNEYVVRIQDMENVKELTQEFKKPSQYVDFVNTIKTTDLLPSFQEKKDKFNDDWKRIITGVPKDEINKLKQNRIEFEKLLETELKQSMLFLKEHIADIENLFRAMIEEQKNKMKQSRKNACKKYYLKKKQELNVSFDPQPEKVVLTEEESIEKKRQARQEYNKKYYLKVKHQLQTAIDIPEEKSVMDLKEKKKLYNKKYYQSKKDKLLQLSKNENEEL